jgi:hypothetical protein
MSLPKSIAEGARPATDTERAAMMKIVERLDAALGAGDVEGLRNLFTQDAVCELKPTGLRIQSLDTIIEMFRRSRLSLSEPFCARKQMRIWANQNGILREWSYPIDLASTGMVPTRLLEVIEFDDALGAIASYRLRMNLLYSRFFDRALGVDFASLAGIHRIPQ